jgi:hypothetical protein
MRWLPLCLMACISPGRTTSSPSAYAIDTGSVLVDSRDTTWWETGDTSGDTARGILGPGELQDGDLRFTEIHLDPVDCPSASWVEVLNTSGSTIRMSDLTLDWGNNRNIRVEIPPGRGFLPPNGYVVIAREGRDACGFGNSLRVRDGLRGNPRALTIRAGGTHLDTVDFTGFNVPTGASLGLHPRVTVITRVRDRRGYWCAQRTPFGLGGDLGTPGAVNEDCPWTTQGVDPSTLQPGDLLITEFLTASVDCADPSGGYIEIVNTTSAAIRIPDLLVGHRNATSATFTHLYDGPPLLDPGAHAVIAMTDVAGSCPWTFDVGYDLPTTSYNQSPLISIYAGSPRRTIDQVDVSMLPDTPGVAWQLDVDAVAADPSANDDPADWCAASALLDGAGVDRGSPNVAVDCDPPEDTADTADSAVVADTADTARPRDSEPDTVPDDTDADTVPGEGNEGDDVVLPVEPTPGCGCGHGGSAPWWLLLTPWLWRSRRVSGRLRGRE